MLGEEDQSRNPGSEGEVSSVAFWLRAGFLLRAREKMRWSRQARPNDVSSKASAHRLSSIGRTNSMTFRIENDPALRFEAGIPLFSYSTKDGTRVNHPFSQTAFNAPFSP